LELSRAALLRSKGDLKAARSAVERYLARNSEDARAWRMLGEVEEGLNQTEVAAKALQQAFILGRYNDVGIARDYLRLLAVSGNRRAIEASAAQVLAIMEQFSKAIDVNTHFIALSANVEKLNDFASVAATLYPQEAATIQKMNTQAQERAKAVRSQFSARKPGYLW
jgi:tetratricopeptide (TPR) repeat protein